MFGVMYTTLIIIFYYLLVFKILLMMLRVNVQVSESTIYYGLEIVDIHCKLCLTKKWNYSKLVYWKPAFEKVKWNCIRHYLYHMYYYYCSWISCNVSSFLDSTNHNSVIVALESFYLFVEPILLRLFTIVHHWTDSVFLYLLLWIESDALYTHLHSFWFTNFISRKRLNLIVKSTENLLNIFLK